MGDNQLKLGKNKDLYEENCRICDKELEDPNVFEIGIDNSCFLCDKHDNWKFKTYIEVQPLLIWFVLPVLVVLGGIVHKISELIDIIKKGDG